MILIFPDFAFLIFIVIFTIFNSLSYIKIMPLDIVLRLVYKMKKKVLSKRKIKYHRKYFHTVLHSLQTFFFYSLKIFFKWSNKVTLWWYFPRYVGFSFWSHIFKCVIQTSASVLFFNISNGKWQCDRFNLLVINSLIKTVEYPNCFRFQAFY